MSRKQSRTVRVPVKLMAQVAELMTERIPLVLVTVGESSGSAPGKAGAKMIVTADRLYGTVGGGRVEEAALRRAREVLAEPAGPVTEKYDVVQDLGMSCGGTMTLLFEPMTASPRLVIFGAGHISEALCAIATRAGFEVTVTDDREDWLTQERFPDAHRRIVAESEVALKQAEIDEQTFVACVTRGHAFDMQAVLAMQQENLKPRYLGVIGSKRKAILLREGLVEKGMTKADAAAIHIPMGLDIGAADPGEIAVSVVAELVAVLRGADTETS